MSSEPEASTDDLVEALGEALRNDEEARGELADAIVDRMQVDDSTPEGEAVKTRRREVLEALGVLGTGAAIGTGSFMAGTQQAAAADTSSGNVGEPGASQDIYLDEILDESGDQVADVDDTGDVVWQRGQQVPSVDTDDLFNTDNPFTVRFWNDGGTWRAHGRTEEIASGSDPDSVLNTAIQNIPNYTSNGAKITFQDDWTQSSQIVVPGTGAYDDNYFPLVFDFETAGVVIEQADGANLDPAWKIETGETNGTHAVGFINPHFEGNRANNSSGGAIKVVQPTGHQSLIRGLFIEHPYILRWPGYCINAERNLYGNLEGGAVGYTDNSFALAWQGNVFGTRVEYAGAEGAWISGYMGGGKIHNNQTNGLVLGDLPNRSTEVTVSQANPQVVRNDRASGNNAEVKTNYNVLFSGTVDGDDSSHPAWNPAGQRARFQGHTFRVSEEVKGGAIGNNSLRGYRGSRTGTPPDLWDGDWWIRQDLSPVELRTYDEQNGTIHHIQRDGSSAP